MARHMADDLTKVTKMSEVVETWYSHRRNDVAIFTPGCWERARFLKFLAEEMEGSYVGVPIHQ